jgi:hypothetical protein
MAEVKVQSKPVEKVRPDDVLMKLGVADYHTCNSSEIKRIQALIREGDKKRKAADPEAKGILPDRTYQSQPMDEFCDAINDLALGKTSDLPSSYSPTGLTKEQAIRLRDAVKVTVELGSKLIVKGHIFDLRFDQRGYGWAKLTENWRKGEDGKNEMQDTFESYKGNDTLKLF